MQMFCQAETGQNGSKLGQFRIGKVKVKRQAENIKNQVSINTENSLVGKGHKHIKQ